MAALVWKRALAYARMARALRRQGRTRDFDDFLRDLFATPPALPPGAFRAMAPAGLDSAARTFIQQTIACLSFVPEDIRHQLLIGFTQGRSAPPLTVALPPYLLRRIKEQGWPVDEAASRDTFQAIVRDHLRRGLRRSARIVVEAAKAMAKGRRKSGRTQVVLHNMYPHMLPQPDHAGGDDNRWDFVSWFRRSDLTPAGTEIWAQSLDTPIDPAQAAAGGVRTTTLPWPFATSPLGLALIVLRLAGIAAAAYWGYLRGQWWRAMVLSAAAETAYVRSLGRERLPDVLVFTNTVQAVRPLWTYLAELLGATVLMIQYSHNHQDDFDPADPSRVILSPTLAAGNSWPDIAVWTEMMKTQGINASAPDSRYRVIGPVGFGDCGATPELPAGRPVVSVFDLAPVHRALIFKRPKLTSFQQEEVVLEYLEDVFGAARAAGFTILFKPKSYFGLDPEAPPTAWPRMTRRYRDLIDKYGCHLAPYGISVMRVAAISDVCVGFPFTSSASAGHLLGVPSIYYDPTETLGPFEDLGQGAPLVMGRDALCDWFAGQTTRADETVAGKVPST